MTKSQLSINGKTGSDVRGLLTEMEFVVPEIQEYPLTPYPQYQPAPTPPPDWTDPVANAEWRVDFLAYQVYVKDAITRRIQIEADNRIKSQAYQDQFTNFANYLRTIFDPLTGKYTFDQVARRLMGYACKRPVNPINFIAYDFKFYA